MASSSSSPPVLASLSGLALPLCTSDWDMVIAVLTGCLNEGYKITSRTQLNLILACATSIHLVPSALLRRQILLLTSCLLVRSEMPGVPPELEGYLIDNWDVCDLGSTITFDDARFLVCLAHRGGRNEATLMCRLLRSPMVAASFLSAHHLHSTLEMVLDIITKYGWAHDSYRQPCVMCALLRCFDSAAPTEAVVADTSLQVIQACSRSGRLSCMASCARARLSESDAADVPLMCFIGALTDPRDYQWLQGRLANRPLDLVARGVVVSLFGSPELASEYVGDLLLCATTGCFPLDTRNMLLYVSRHSPRIAAVLGKALLNLGSAEVAAHTADVLRRHAFDWSRVGRLPKDPSTQWMGEGFYMVVCLVFRDLIGLVRPATVLATLMLLNAFKQDTADSEALVSTALDKIIPEDLADLVNPLQSADELITGLEWLACKGSEICNRLCLSVIYRSLLLPGRPHAAALIAVTAGGLPFRDRLDFLSSSLRVYTAEQCAVLSEATCRLIECDDTDPELARRMLVLVKDSILRCAEPAVATSLFEVFLRSGRRWASILCKLLFIPAGFDGRGVLQRVVTGEYDFVSKRLVILRWLELQSSMRFPCHLRQQKSSFLQRTVAPVDSPDARVLDKETPRLMSTGIEEELPQSAYKPQILSPETKEQLGYFSRVLARLGAESGQLHSPARSEDISKFMKFKQTKCCAPEVTDFDAFAESEGLPVRAENISVNLQELKAINLDGEADYAISSHGSHSTIIWTLTAAVVMAW
ncbi:Delta 8 Fatty Acid Desaturase [Perkinsus chesapeaki]|uniref:Delta 8 Fatty Acid Desaturase n=1 Tax=Perkinsus chesapeaki TaxID=330153 RepID=A0A7J6MHI4_PERCH|nr:Delta 8 Fatty Acid Desaturase [Perkinsus chesapeaki]